MLRVQFNIRQLALVTLVYAFLFAILAPLPLSFVQILAASGVVTLFVIADLLFAGSDGESIPIVWRAAQTVAKYATSLALAMAVCFFLYLGRTDAIAADSAFRGQSWLVIHVAIFGILSVIAFFAALTASQHSNLAVGLMFLNTPGVTLAAFMIYAAWHIQYVHG